MGWENFNVRQKSKVSIFNFHLISLSEYEHVIFNWRWDLLEEFTHTLFSVYLIATLLCKMGSDTTLIDRALNGLIWLSTMTLYSSWSFSTLVRVWVDQVITHMSFTRFIEPQNHHRVDEHRLRVVHETERTCSARNSWFHWSCWCHMDEIIKERILSSREVIASN